MRYEYTRADSKYGASMGRRTIPTTDPVKLHLQRVKVNAGGYDPGGAYWGIAHYGFDLYVAFDVARDVEVFVRAYSRDAAKRNVQRACPRATFYR